VRLGVLILLLASSLAFSQNLEQAKKAYQAQNYKTATEILQAVVTKDPQDLEAQFLLGLADMRLEQWDLAVLQFRKVIELDADHLPAYLQLGLIYEKKKDIPRAQEAWKKVLDLAKDEKTKHFAQKHLGNLKP